MTTLIIDEDIKLEQTHFKTFNEFKKFIWTKISLSENLNNDFIWWTDDEINEFERQNTMDFLKKLEEKEWVVDWDSIFIKWTK